MLKRGLLVLVVLISVSDYGVRAHRLIAKVGISDFQDPYIGAQLWRKGENLYDRDTVRKTWTEATSLSPINEIKTVYPPTTYFLLLPFSFFGYRVALAIWVALQLASVFVIAAIVRGQKWFAHSLLATMALVTSYSPFHTALHAANPGPLCMALALASCLMQSEKAAGIVLAISICIKPQIAVWFLLFLIVKKKWIAFMTCIATGVVISAISLAPYFTQLPDLASAYHNQYSRSFEHGSSGDYTRDRSDRLSMVNLQPAVYQFTRSTTAANAFAVLIFCLLAGWWFHSARNSQDRLLVLASLVALSIIPIYRRTYDLGLLVLPLVWGIRNLQERLAVVVAVCAGLFFIPINSILARINVYGVLSGFQSWVVLAMTIVLIFALRKSQASEWATTFKPPDHLNPEPRPYQKRYISTS